MAICPNTCKERLLEQLAMSSGTKVTYTHIVDCRLHSRPPGQREFAYPKRTSERFAKLLYCSESSAEKAPPLDIPAFRPCQLEEGLPLCRIQRVTCLVVEENYLSVLRFLRLISWF